MKTGMDVMRERGMNLDQEFIPDTEFAKANLPMVVTCTGCRATMAFISCQVDDEKNCWCTDCAPAEQPKKNTGISYKHLWTWDRMMGSTEQWSIIMQNEAEKEGAPWDAIYKSHDGKWECWSNIAARDTMDVFKTLYKALFNEEP